jgi:hypothetical protein
VEPPSRGPSHEIDSGQESPRERLSRHAWNACGGRVAGDAVATAHMQPWTLQMTFIEYALTVNVSGLPPVEQISHPKSTCPICA